MERVWDEKAIREPVIFLKQTAVLYDYSQPGNGTLVDRETRGLDDGGNWLSHTRSATSLMETRTAM